MFRRLNKRVFFTKAAAVFFLFPLSGPLSAKTIYHYEPEKVTITGTVTTMLFPGPPGYGENKTDKKVAVPVVVLPAAVDVLPVADVDKDDPDSQPETNITRMQIFSYDGPINIRGCAQLEGSLMHQVAAGHYTRVLLVVNNAKHSDQCTSH